MTDEPEAPQKKPRRAARMIVAMVLAVGAGAGAYHAAVAGLLPLPTSPLSAQPTASNSPVAYVPIPSLSVPLSVAEGTATLRISAQIEVDPASADAVENAMPRILDAANAYLRAVDPTLLEGSSAHVRVKGQLLRRVRLIAGEDAVHDLLLTEMVTI